MEYDIPVSSLDELNTPIMMCDPDGLVIYKNEAAVKEVRLPKRRTHMQPHLNPDDLGKFGSISDMKKPGVFTVDTGDRKVRAFVVPYSRQGKKCSLWVFMAIIQINSKTRYTRAIENDLMEGAGELCELIENIDEKSFYTGARKQVSVDKRIRKKIDNVISYMFGGEKELYPLGKGICLMTDAAVRTFGKFGYRITSNLSGFPVKESTGLYVDFKSFSLFFYHLLAYFIECGADGVMNVGFSLEDTVLKVKLLLSMPYPPYYTEVVSDFEKLAVLSPASIIDVLVLEKFAESYGYELSVAINDDHMNNMAVVASLPVIRRMTVREKSHSAEIDELLLEGDLMLMFYYMLRFRGFRAKENSNA